MRPFDTALKLYDRKLATLRLPVLTLLAGHDGYSMSMVEMAGYIGVGVPTLSEAAAVWERAGVIKRLTPKKDRRSTTLTLTPKGLEDARVFAGINCPE